MKFDRPRDHRLKPAADTEPAKAGKDVANEFSLLIAEFYRARGRLNGFHLIVV